MGLFWPPEELFCVERMGAHVDEWHVAPCKPDWNVYMPRDQAEQQLAALQIEHPSAVFRVAPRMTKGFCPG